MSENTVKESVEHEQKPPCPLCIADGATLDSVSFFTLGLQMGAIHYEALPESVAHYVCVAHRPRVIDSLVRVAEVFRQVQP